MKMVQLKQHWQGLEVGRVLAQEKGVSRTEHCRRERENECLRRRTAASWERIHIGGGDSISLDLL